MLMKNYLADLANSASMALTTSGASGFVPVGKRATTLPLRPITNFSKFHLIGPSLVSCLYSGAALSPLTSIFENRSNETSYFVLQN